MHLLDQEAPGLADQLKQLPLERRRCILSKTFRLAGATFVDLESEIKELITKVVNDNALTPSQLEQVRMLAEAADEQYFRLQEQGAAEVFWLEWFSKARLLTALWNGFGGTSWNDSANSVYELTKTRDDPSEILALVRGEIESVRP